MNEEIALPHPRFESFVKIPRFSRKIVITEKIDGTNAQICITEDNQIYVGSRNRWIQPGPNDNYGFARWVWDNEAEILKLGPGRHYGEWWGRGIQRHYGLKEKRFSLFNVHRWGDSPKDGQLNHSRPTCCYVVPTLYQGSFDQHTVDFVLDSLRYNGSVAAPGFMKPEGIVIFHTAGNLLFKKTLEKDDQPKGAIE